MLRRLKYRLRCAWAAFCHGGSWHHGAVSQSQRPIFAVIYDDPNPGHRCDPEVFYEAFEDPDEAYEMFSTAYPLLVDRGEDGANARLVLILGPIGNYKPIPVAERDPGHAGLVFSS